MYNVKYKMDMYSRGQLVRALLLLYTRCWIYLLHKLLEGVRHNTPPPPPKLHP